MNKYLDIQWTNYIRKNNKNNPIEQDKQSRLCTLEDMTKEYYDTNRMYLCPPKNLMKFYNSTTIFPYKAINLSIKAKPGVSNEII